MMSRIIALVAASSIFEVEGLTLQPHVGAGSPMTRRRRAELKLAGRDAPLLGALPDSPLSKMKAANGAEMTTDERVKGGNILGFPSTAMMPSKETGIKAV